MSPARPFALSSSRRRPLAVALLALSVGAGCPALPPEQAPIVLPPTGTIVGEVFAEDGGTQVSVAGAVVEIYGTSARVLSQLDRQWVLPGIRVGDHRIRITDPEGARFVETIASVQTRNQTVILEAKDTTVRPAARLTGSVAVDDPAGTVVFLVGGTSAQVALAGDDGTFALDNLPSGDIQLGASKQGFSPAVVDVNVEPGDNALPEPIGLTATVINNLKLSGRIELDLRADFSGVAVTLNDGVAVAVTAADGSYAFENLAPGGYRLKAQLPGFRTVELPGLVLTESGQTLGLVEVFMSPGQDDQIIDFPEPTEGEGEGEPPPPTTVEIVFPAPNDAFPGGAPVVLAADVENADAATVQWSLADQLGANPVPLPTLGATIVADLPIVEVETFFTVTATVGDVSDAVIIRVQPPVVAEVQAEASILGVGLPPDEPLVEGGVLVGLRLRIQQGHPADVRPAAGLIAVWTDVGGGAFQNTLPVSTLPVGTHRFTGATTTSDGQVGSVVVEVVVSALEFDVVVVEPSDQNDYFVDTGLPLRATVSHGWQTSFLSSSVAWRLPSGRVVGTGVATTGQGVEAGLDVVTIEVVDLAGNRRVNTVPFALDAVEFTGFFNAPTAGSIVQVGTPVRVNVGFDHNRLSDAERAAAFVQVISDRQGLLTLDGGATTTAPATDAFISTLQEGSHIITARVFAGGRIAQTTTSVAVQAKFVSSALVAPVRDLVAIAGEQVSMEVAASGGNGAIPQVRWFMDGVEFPSTWPGYGTDPAALARRALSFGTFDPAVFPFDDVSFWSDGPHVIEVSVAADDVDPGLGCVTLGTRAQCRAFNVQVSRQVRVISSPLTIGPSVTEVWDGVIRLQTLVTINGGTLVVLPGTRVLVDMRDPQVPATQTGNSGNRAIQLSLGELRVGDAGNVTPVVFETLKSFASTNRWGGIRDNSTVANFRTVSVRNAVLRDATLAMEFEGIDLNNNDRQLVIEDVVVEDSDNGINLECPTVMDRVTVRRIAGNGRGIGLRLQTACPAALRYEDLDLSAPVGIFLQTALQPTTVTLQRIEADSRIIGVATQANVNLELLDSTLSGVTGNSTLDAALDVDNGGDVVVRRTVFENSTHAIVFAGNTRSVDIRDSIFRTLVRGITVRGVTPDASFEVHGNSFIDVARIASYDGGNRDVLEMQGNFMGGFAAPGSAAQAVKSTDVGEVPVVIGPIVDHLDSLTSGNDFGRVRIDNPLPTATLPLAVIREPNESEPWNTRQCVPFRAVAVDDTFDVDANCEFRLGPLAGSADAASPVDVDGNGCLLDPQDGSFGVHLVCSDPDRETVHSSRLLIDSSRFSGPIHPDGDTWSGTIVVDGDVVVPAGVTLNVAPGTTVRFQQGDRSFHKRPAVPLDTNFNGFRQRGSPTRSDLFVDGAIVALGAAAAPIRFIADVGQQRSTWSGFVMASGASLTLSEAAIESTVATFSSDPGLQATLFPSFELTNVTVAHTPTVASGGCPGIINGLQADVVDEVYNCRMGNSVELRNAAISNINGNTSWFNLDDATGSVTPSFLMDDVTATGNPANRRGAVFAQFGTGRVTLRDTALSNTETAVTLQGATQTAEVTGSRFVNFVTAFSIGNDDEVDVADSLFQQGTTFLLANLGRTAITRSRFVGVTRIFDDGNLTGNVAIDVTANQFEGSDVVFAFSQVSNGSGPTQYVFSGNNFIGTTQRVLRFTGGAANTIATIFDLSGSHFGAADRETVVTLVEDVRTDAPADPDDDNEGRTLFAGFSATPLPLVLP